MKVFVAGGGGAVGKRLVPLLVEGGHEVAALTRSPEREAGLLAAGATPVIADGLDRDAVIAAVRDAAPEVVVHQMTALAGGLDFRRFDKTFAQTKALRTQGTDNLLAAARKAGAHRFVAQSFAGWPYARTGGPVKTETDPLDPDPPPALKTTLDAIRHLERQVMTPGLEGIVLRYGGFYGPGTSLGPEGGEQIELIRKRRWPVVGDGTGVWSLIHIEDVAAASLAAIEGGEPGIYNVGRRRARACARVVALSRRGNRSKASPTRAGLGRTPCGRRAWPRDDDHRPGSIEREGQTRARVVPALSELARGLQDECRGPSGRSPASAGARRYRLNATCRGWRPRTVAFRVLTR